MDLLTKQPIVIDNGTSIIKAGYAGEDKPAVLLRNVVGRPKHVRVMAGGALEGTDVFIGKKLEDHRGALALSHPMEHGIVQNWNDLECLWNACYGGSSNSSSSNSSGSSNTANMSSSSSFTAKASEHPLLLTEAPHTSKPQRETAAQILFESLYVPALYISPSSPLALYASGRTTGCVLECGDGVTTATPIYEGYAIPHAVIRAEYGGEDVTRQLGLLLRKAGLPLHTSAELESVRSMKESICYVAASPTLEEGAVLEGRIPFTSVIGAGAGAGAKGSSSSSSATTTSTTAAEFRLPDGTRICVGAERFRAPEVLFRPSILGLEYRGVADMVSMAIARSDMDLRSDLFASVVLAGGATSTRGFGARMLSELRKTTPADVKVKVWAPSDRSMLTWVGGSILASLSTFRKLWVTKAMWEEEGPSLMHRATV